jgi:M6 family metalloprotease-like protein
MTTHNPGQKAIKRASLALVSLLVSSILIAPGQAAEADRKRDSWLASCPPIENVDPLAPTPKGFALNFQNTGQLFVRLADNGTDFAGEESSAIGCYVVEDLVSNPETSPQWQIGTLNRGASGYYFLNAAGIIWDLSLSSSGEVFEIQPGARYYSEPGLGFRIVSRALDCKVRDLMVGPLRNGHPRNPLRVSPKGETRNLVITVDFPDAPLTATLSNVVNDIVGPQTVTDFFLESSYGKLRPTFENFPHVVRMRSNQSSFAPLGPGRFFVNGVQQDDRLVDEALEIAQTKGSIANFESITIFAPTAKSLLYYGATYVGRSIKAGGETLLNVQMVGGDIGNNMSEVPSWRVVAHEYGHLLGMYDYYIISGGGSTGRSPGPFDLMGNTSGEANSILGFQRWVQGWLEDDQVHCDLEPDEARRHELSPINSGSGKSLYVHPVDGFVALVAEYRTDSKFDKLKGQDGLLVYTIDMRVGTGRGPITIHPSEQDRVSTAANDVARYLTAPLSAGQFVRIGDVAIVAESVNSSSATLVSMPSSKLQPYLDARALEASAQALREAKEAADKAKSLKPKTIVCRKGTQTRRVTAIAPRCPTGFKVQVTITCFKGTVKRTVTAINPKCPAGFKRR